MKYKVKIRYTYQYFSMHITFEKIYELPFVPFYNMSLSDGDCCIDFVNTQYTKCCIMYELTDDIFVIYMTASLPRHYDVDEIDYLVNDKYNTWNRVDMTDIEEFKKFIKRNYE